MDVQGTFRVSKTSTLEGNLDVLGNNVYFADEKLYINRDGTAATSIGAGLYVDDGDSNYEAGYIRTNSDGGWDLKELRSGNVLTFGISGTKMIGVSGGLDIEADSAINQDLTTDSQTVQFSKITVPEIISGSANDGLEYTSTQWSDAYTSMSDTSALWQSTYNTVQSNILRYITV